MHTTNNKLSIETLLTLLNSMYFFSAIVLSSTAALLAAVLRAESPGYSPFSLFHASVATSGRFEAINATTPTQINLEYLVISHQVERHPNYDYSGYVSAVDPLFTWINMKNVVWSTPTDLETSFCDGTPCDSVESCKPVYWCLAEQTKNRGVATGANLEFCIHRHFPDASTRKWECMVTLRSLLGPLCTEQEIDAIDASDWDAHQIDDKIQTVWRGGSIRKNSRHSVYFQGQIEETFASALGRQLLNVRDFQCTVKKPCDTYFTCDDTGSWTAYEGGSSGRPLSLDWAYIAMTGLTNLNKELVNRYDALEKSKGDLALEAFNIDDYFPKKGQNFGLLNSLTGLSGLFAIVGGFVPVTAVAGALGAAGTIASGVAGFASNAVAAKLDPLEAAVRPYDNDFILSATLSAFLWPLMAARMGPPFATNFERLNQE